MIYAQVIVKSRRRVEALTYQVPVQFVPLIKIGSLVMVPLQRRRVSGVVVAFRRSTSRLIREKIRSIAALKNQQRLSPQQLKVIRRLAETTGSSLAEVAFHALNSLPSLRSQTSDRAATSKKPLFVEGTTAQRLAFYRQLMKKYAPGHRLLILFAKRAFAQAFAATNDGELQGAVKATTIGETFSPLQANDIIIVDEPYHLGSRFSQRPYLTAKQIALVRATVENLQLVIGSALVALEDYPSIRRGGWLLVKREKIRRPLLVVDRRASNELIMPSLQDRLVKALERGKRCLVLALSRGWASALICRRCGYLFRCSNCNRTVAVAARRLQCRYCGKLNPWPPGCPSCRHEDLAAIGEGIGQFVEALSRLLPHVKIQELSTENPQLAKHSQLVVATEKIFSFPAVAFDETFVLSADRLLSGAKLNGIGTLLEHLLELQAVSGTVSVQTFFPDHLIWGIAGTGDTETFYMVGLKSRRKLRLPPFGSLIVLTGQAHRARLVLQEAEALGKKIERLLPQAEVSYPEIVDKSGRNYRAEIAAITPRVLSGRDRQQLARLIPPGWAILHQ